MARRFEFIGGTSAKFWEIEIQANGINVIVRWGRIGSVGQMQTKSFPYAYQVNEFVAKMIAEKLGKGYMEVGTAPPMLSATTPAAVKIPAKVPALPQTPVAPAAPACRSMRRLAKRVINVAADNIETDSSPKEHHEH